MQARLIQSRGVQINHMPIHGCTVSETFVELQESDDPCCLCPRHRPYFDRFLHVLGVVFFDIVMRANGMFEFFVDDNSRALRTWTRNEHHDSSADTRVERLESSPRSEFREGKGPRTSRRPVATDRAAPVDRRARLPCSTGQGSRWSSPRRSVKDMSHADNG